MPDGCLVIVDTSLTQRGRHHYDFYRHGVYYPPLQLIPFANITLPTHSRAANQIIRNQYR